MEAFYSPQGRMEFEYLKGYNFSLYECDVCGLIFQREIPNDNLMERLYEYWIDPKEAFNSLQKKKGIDYYSFFASEIMQILAYFNKIPSSLSFFDFGMGWGRWAMMAKAFGCDSYGSELSNSRIEYAKSNGVNVIKWDEIPSYQFDFINAEQVFEHIPEPLETLYHLQKSLKPKGILKISVLTGSVGLLKLSSLNSNGIKRRFRIMGKKLSKETINSINPIAPLEHINFFRRKTIISMASKAGMEEVFIPLKLQYQFATHWSGMKRIVENILLPIYRNIFRRQNYIFLRLNLSGLETNEK